MNLAQTSGYQPAATQVATGENKQCCSCANSVGCYQTSPQQTAAGGSVAVQPVAVQPTGTAQASSQPQKGYGDVRRKKFSSRHRQRQIFGRGTMVNHMAVGLKSCILYGFSFLDAQSVTTNSTSEKREK